MQLICHAGGDDKQVAGAGSGGELQTIAAMNHDLAADHGDDRLDAALLICLPTLARCKVQRLCGHGGYAGRCVGECGDELRNQLLGTTLVDLVMTHHAQTVFAWSRRNGHEASICLRLSDSAGA